MPLTHLEGPIAPELSGIWFQMADGSDRVRVFVTYIAIEDLESPATFDQHGAIERFERRRDTFEEIASRKFDQGKLQSDGSVRVGQADL